MKKRQSHLRIDVLCVCVNINIFLLTHSFLTRFFANETSNYGWIFEYKNGTQQIILNRNLTRTSGTLPIIFDVKNIKIQSSLCYCVCVNINIFLLTHSFLTRFFANETSNYGWIFEYKNGTQQIILNRNLTRTSGTLPIIFDVKT